MSVVDYRKVILEVTKKNGYTPEPETLVRMVDNHSRDEARMLASCRSPMERVFLEAALEVHGFIPLYGFFDRGKVTRRTIQMDARYNVGVNGLAYELDFYLSLVGDCEPYDDAIMVDVEIDGRDFHEKTKEQAARDKSRDRALTAAGYSVVRFTGAEVYADSAACVAEAISIVRALEARVEAIPGQKVLG